MIKQQRLADGTTLYGLGEPDEIRNGVPLYWVPAWRENDPQAIARSLGLTLVGGFDFWRLSQLATPARWPRSWLLKAWFWQGWRVLLYRVLIYEILGRHLYLINWAPMREGYVFTWRECFRPFRWARTLRARFG